jgi:hypothetical protein
MATVSNKQLMAMRKAGYSDEEIQQMLADDKRVDKGEILEWDMSTEEHKKAMKYANVTDKKPKTEEKSAKKGGTAYNFDTSQRKRKENPTKAGIIAEIATFLLQNAEFAPENVEIANKERQITFKIGDTAFDLTLVQKRKPK